MFVAGSLRGAESPGLRRDHRRARQLARAHFGLGWWLWERGRTQAAERHFIRGIDPMGPQFREMLQEWVGGGTPYYRPLADTRGEHARG